MPKRIARERSRCASSLGPSSPPSAAFAPSPPLPLGAVAPWLCDALRFLQAEDKIDKAARAKIASQKREILEGSEEHDLLVRRYYAEEMKKLGVDLPRP